MLSIATGASTLVLERTTFTAGTAILPVKGSSQVPFAAEIQGLIRRTEKLIFSSVIDELKQTLLIRCYQRCLFFDSILSLFRFYLSA